MKYDHNDEDSPDSLISIEKKPILKLSQRQRSHSETSDYEQPLQRSNSYAEPVNVEMPRKGTNFRVVLERKLGVDWEHAPEDRNSEFF